MDNVASGIPVINFVETVAFLLREAFEGAPEGQPNAFLDKGVGFFSTLAELSADAASRSVEGSTIAAHTEHAKFYLDRLCEFIRGQNEPVNWEDSWLIEVTITPAAFAAHRASRSPCHNRAQAAAAARRRTR